MKIKFLLLLLVIFYQYSVYSQENVIKAQEHFNKGAILFKEGKYESAIIEMKTANELIPHKDFVYNIAVCYEKMKNFDSAIKYFEEFLKMDISPDEKIDAEKRLKKLKDEIELGEIEITVSQALAEVFVDNQMVGKSPIKILKLKKGKHKIDVKKDGFKDFSSYFEIKPLERTKLNVLLEKEILVEKKEKSPYSLWKWVSIGSGVAFGGAGVAMTILSNNKYQEVEDAMDKRKMKIKEALSLIDKGKTYRNISYIFYGLGGASILGSGVLFYFDIKAKENEKRKTFMIIPSQKGILIKGEF